MKESVIRQMTRLAVEHKAINLSQGFTDEAPPFDLVWGGISALLAGTDDQLQILESTTVQDALGDADTTLSIRDLLAGLQHDRDRFNQYSFPFGLPELRTAIANYTERFYHYRPDPDTRITVVLGATEGLSSALRAVCHPGDGLVVFQPFHEMYPAQADLFGLVPHYVTLRENPDAQTWEMDRRELEVALSVKPRAIILNTPHNPTGKVFSEDDLRFIANLCIRHDVLAITDEIYEHILYDGHQHLTMAAFDDMRDRTVVINSISKTGSATGWRIGWVISPEKLTTAIRSVHDTMVIQAPTPLQRGAIRLLQMDDTAFKNVAAEYDLKRKTLMRGLQASVFHITPPEGSYYLFANYRSVPIINDMPPMDAAMHLIREIGVATVPGDNFYRIGNEGQNYLRFAFCRSLESLEEAARRLSHFLK